MSNKEMTMVERVARRLCAASSGHWREPPFNDLHSDALNNHWRFKARAVIDEMRVPTSDMLFAASAVSVSDEAWTYHSCGPLVLAVSDALVTSALEDES